MDSQSDLRQNRVICVPFTEDEYKRIVDDPKQFRSYLDRMVDQYPEIFPAEMLSGYEMKDRRPSKKLSIPIRRIEVDGIAYTIRPSYIMPHMTGLVKEAEHALFLRKFGVPFWAIAHVFGRDAMHWYRAVQSLGRNSLVGTTVKDPENLPVHLAADEKHTRLTGKKAYVAVTAAEGCILGASVALNAGEDALTGSIRRFQRGNPESQP